VRARPVTRMNRQQVIALIFAGLMLVSSIGAVASVF
jgi:hypothetical protein